MTGTQRIGWDPLAKTIRSWSFDSEGGFTEGVWSRQGNQWIIKTTGVTSDGKAASSTNYMTRLHKHRLTWESRDRFVGGEKTADIGPITIARQPPAPGALYQGIRTRNESGITTPANRVTDPGLMILRAPLNAFGKVASLTYNRQPSSA